MNRQWKLLTPFFALAVIVPLSLDRSDGIPARTNIEPIGTKSLTPNGPPKEVEEVGALTGTTFIPINPYRTWDSRQLNRTLYGGGTQLIEVYTNMQDIAVIPYNAVAVSYNLTVTNTDGWGYLSVYPADIYNPGTSAINWTGRGQTIANGGIVAIGDWAGFYGAVEVSAGPTQAGVRTDYIIDITGYFI